MQIGHIEGTTHVIGKSQGFLGLPVRIEATECPVSGETIAMTTAWHPTPDELQALINGAAIHVRLINVVQHPPIMLGVGPEPDPV